MSITFSCGALHTEKRKEVNFGNGHASFLMRMIGFEPEEHGFMPFETLPWLQQNILRCLNLPEKRKPFLLEWKEEVSGQYMTKNFSVTDEMWVIRLRELAEVVRFGIENKLPLEWA